MKRWAVISPCGKYRYILGREEDGELFPAANQTVVFVLNNPSVADAEIDDNTVKKCWRYAQRWEYRRMVFVNTNPWRSTDPKFAREPSDEAAAENDTYLQGAVADANLVVCAWGSKARQHLVHRAIKVIAALDVNLCYLELAKDGSPKHPLYLPGYLEPKPWLSK